MKISGSTWLKIFLLFAMISGISLLHYGTEQNWLRYHAFFGELYFLPIVLAGLWFNLEGALITSAVITLCYIPFMIWTWENFSSADIDRMVSVALYNGLAVLVGILKRRETAAQEKLVQAEGLVAVGRSLAAVAHDLKAPLVVIGGLTRRVWQKLTDGDPAREKLAIVMRETSRMENMTRDMLDFSRPLTLHRTSVDLDTTLRNSLALAGEAARKRKITLAYEPEQELPEIMMDGARVEQALVNLLLNAIQASPGGGTVTLRARRSPDGVIVDVIDCGCGIPAEQRRKVFDPFFTTKKEGTGLGLPIVRKIIEAHGWSMHILDKADRGTIFRIVIS
ncbi:sensor histidine kinase [Thermodesulfobacteriota bacterium B35]